MKAINKLVAEVATVTRDGEKKQVPGADLHPGDIVHLALGDRVPADVKYLTKCRYIFLKSPQICGSIALS